MTLGEYIKITRNEKGMSQRALAMRTGISNTTISRIEANSVNPDARSLTAIADTLQVDPAMLFKLAGYLADEKKAPSHEDAKKIKYDDAIEIFDKLTPEQYQLVLERARGYAELNAKHKK